MSRSIYDVEGLLSEREKTERFLRLSKEERKKLAATLDRLDQIIASYEERLAPNKVEPPTTDQAGEGG